MPDAEPISIRIRPALPGDSERLAQLQHLLWPDYEANDHLEHLQKLFTNEASTLPLTIFVAENAAGELVGFLEAGLRSHANGCDPALAVGFIEGWYVDERYRRRGVGRALAHAAEDWARAEGCKEMASDTQSDNELSQRAHEGLGYDAVETCTQFRKPL